MIFIDMDDVLASWKNQFIKYNKQWLNINEIENGWKIYLDLDPVDNMIKAVKEMKDQGMQICILTAAPDDGGEYSNICSAKKEWLKKYMPFIDLENEFICVETNMVKISAAEKVKAAKSRVGRNLSLHTDDVLIDDNLKNLKAWKSAGGTPIQFVTNMHYQHVGEFQWLKSINHMATCKEIVNSLKKPQDEDDFF